MDALGGFSGQEDVLLAGEVVLEAEQDLNIHWFYIVNTAEPGLYGQKEKTKHPELSQ